MLEPAGEHNRPARIETKLMNPIPRCGLPRLCAAAKVSSAATISVFPIH